MPTDIYTSPLSERYAGKDMQYIFSQDMKFRTWRRLWIALAETEMELGLTQITPEMIEQADLFGVSELKVDGRAVGRRDADSVLERIIAEYAEMLREDAGICSE